MQPTEWRPIPEFEGFYEASDSGEIRRVAPGAGSRLGQTLKQTPQMNGNLRVSLSMHGVIHSRRVHSLVAAAFHGARPEGAQVRHLDGSKVNNAASNLAWGTIQENMRDKVEHGTNVPWNGQLTACTRGHEFTEENTRIRHRGGRPHRVCLTCQSQYNRAYKKAGRAASKGIA